MPSAGTLRPLRKVTCGQWVVSDSDMAGLQRSVRGGAGIGTAVGSGRVAALACASQNAQRCCAAKSGVGPILPGDSVNGVSPSKRGQAGRPPPLGSPLRAKAPQ